MRIMRREKLIEIIQGIIETDVDLSFLLQLEENELETQVACIREQVDQAGGEGKGGRWPFPQNLFDYPQVQHYSVI